MGRRKKQSKNVVNVADRTQNRKIRLAGWIAMWAAAVFQGFLISALWYLAGTALLPTKGESVYPWLALGAFLLSLPFAAVLVGHLAYLSSQMQQLERRGYDMALLRKIEKTVDSMLQGL